MDLQNLTITDILEGYNSKKFSVSEIVNAYLLRIEQINPRLNAFITIDSQNAKNKAKALDNATIKNPLHEIGRASCRERVSSPV